MVIIVLFCFRDISFHNLPLRSNPIAKLSNNDGRSTRTEDICYFETVKNTAGDPVSTTYIDKAGNTVKEVAGSTFTDYTYDRLGSQICYTDGIYDESTELYYLNARYYDPENGRFISQDTYRGQIDDPGQWHLYAYCANNPINYVDPSGHSRHQWVYVIVRFGELTTLANSYDSKRLSNIIADHLNDYLKGKMNDVYLEPLGKYKAYKLFSKVSLVVDITAKVYRYKEWCANRKSIAVAKAIRKFYNKEYRKKGGKRKVVFGTEHKRTGRGTWVLTGESYFNLTAS